ncbi:MAG: phage portal protein [Mycobacteriales bacterium]
MARKLLAEGFGKATPIHEGLLARFTGGVRSEISTISPMSWMNPAQPMRRVAPAGTQPRIWDYRFGQNIDYTPKAFEGLAYETLHALADGYDLLRMVIETRKDQVARVPHSFTVKPLDATEPPSSIKERQNSDKRIQMLNEFWKKPDGMHSFSDWQRAILEDMFVIDAPSIVPRWRMDGGLYGYDVIDGSTISLLVDEQGRTPMPPDPAYRQIIKGMPSVDMMSPCAMLPGTDQIFYFPRNIRTSRLYGFSPVEQIVVTVNIGIRRQISQLQYFTEGTIPDVFLEAPEGVPEDRLTQLETMWNEKFATTAARRKANFIPYGTSVTFAKDPKLKDELDEYLARKVAYAFSVSPTALVKMVNRAAGQQMSEDAKAEGLEPILYWFKELMDELLDFMGCGDIEFSWGSYTRENPLVQAQVNQIYLSTIDDQGHSVMRAGEIREDLGLEPIDYEAEEEIARQQDIEDTASANAHELEMARAKGGSDPNEEDAASVADDGGTASDDERKQKQEERASSPNPKAVGNIKTCVLCKTGMKLVQEPMPHHLTANGVELLCDDNLLVSKALTTAAKKKDFASKRAKRLRASSRRSLAPAGY